MLEIFQHGEVEFKGTVHDTFLGRLLLIWRSCQGYNYKGVETNSLVSTFEILHAFVTLSQFKMLKCLSMPSLDHA